MILREDTVYVHSETFLFLHPCVSADVLLHLCRDASVAVVGFGAVLLHGIEADLKKIHVVEHFFALFEKQRVREQGNRLISEMLCSPDNLHYVVSQKWLSARKCKRGDSLSCDLKKPDCVFRWKFRITVAKDGVCVLAETAFQVAPECDEVAQYDRFGRRHSEEPCPEPVVKKPERQVDVPPVLNFPVHSRRVAARSLHPAPPNPEVAHQNTSSVPAGSEGESH